MSGLSKFPTHIDNYFEHEGVTDSTSSPGLSRLTLDDLARAVVAIENRLGTSSGKGDARNHEKRIKAVESFDEVIDAGSGDEIWIDQG